MITTWNRSAEKLYGYPAAEAVGKSLSLVTLPKDLAQVLANIELIKNSKQVKRFETIRLHKEGQLIDLEIELSPVKNDAGEVIGVSTIARNITERKRHESNLAFLAEINLDFAPLLTVHEVMEQVGERLVRHLQLSRCHFSIIDEEHDQAEVVYEYRVDENLPGMMGVHRISDNFSEEGKRHLMSGKLAVMNDASDKPLMRTKNMLDHFGFSSLIDIPHLENGKWRFLLTIGRSEPAIWRKDEVDLLQVLAAKIYTRIERARTEEALQRSELKLRRLSESGIISVAFFDTEGAIIEANDAFLDMLGVTRDELNSEKIRWDVYTHEAWMPRTRQAVEEFKKTGYVRPYEKQFYHTSGELRWGIFAGADLGDGQTGVAFVLDITERKNAEEALRKSEEKYLKELELEVLKRTEEIVKLNTELRKLNTITADNYTETLRHVYINLETIVTTDARNLSNSSRANLRRAQAAIQKMKLLSNDINNYLLLYDFEIKKENIEPNDILQNVIESLQKKIDESNAKIDIDQLPSLNTDPVLFTKLMTQLIDNSIKFRKENTEPLINISYSLVDHIVDHKLLQEKPFIVISISDNGIGFEKTETIFEPFIQLQDRSKHKGAGMGLAICKKIMEMHGGFITADSTPDHGATFNCYFPQ